jgi:hypothetical protein
MTAFAVRTALDEAVTDEAGVDFRDSAGGACHSAACSTWPTTQGCSASLKTSAHWCRRAAVCNMIST